MKTFILDRPGEFSFAEMIAPDRAAPGEALVRVHRVGICGTDLHAYRGRQPYFTYPRVLGHELGVEIIEVGPNRRNLRAGDRCAVEPYLNCGHCIACRRGKPNCCAQLKVMGVHTDGGMREVISVPVDKLHPSDALSYEQLALVETLCIGEHAVQRAGIERDEWVLVVGAGPIGLSVVQFAQASGAHVIALDTNAARLEFCRSQLHVEHTVLAGPESLAQIEALTGGDRATAVFDATGNAASMMGSFAYAASGGRLVFVGLVQADITFNDPDFHRRELTLFATRNASAGDFERAIDLMEIGQIDTRPWITHRANYLRFIEEFPSWLLPETGVIKAMLEF